MSKKSKQLKINKSKNIILILALLIILIAFLIPNNFIGKITNQCTGCIYNETCLPVGTRLPDNTYCDADGNLKDQLLTDRVCTHNYECQTNICIDKCKSYSTLKESYCKYREALGYGSYNECITGV